MKKFRGKVIILKPKTNSGIVLLENGIKTDMINFAKTLEDGDPVIIEFKDDNPNGEILGVKYCGEEYYYGFIISGNTVVCNYPKMYGAINFAKLSDQDFTKLARPDKNNPKFMTISFVQVKFQISKDNFQITARNLEIVDETEQYKCSGPQVANYSANKLQYYFSTKDKVTKEVVIRKQSVFIDKSNKKALENIYELSTNDLYFIYIDKKFNTQLSRPEITVKEIFKIDKNNINQLINCYKISPDSIKITIIDSLIEANLTIKNFHPNELKREKIRILTELAKLDKKWLIELQKIKYKPEELNTAENPDPPILEMQSVEMSEKHFISRRSWAIEI